MWWPSRGATRQDRQAYHASVYVIGHRLTKQLKAEVEKLREMGYGPQLKSQQALGYKQMHRVLDGELQLPEAITMIQRETRHYARRQLTWLRKEEGLEWRTVNRPEEIINRAVQYFKEKT